MRHVFDYIRKHKRLLLILVPALIYHMFVIMPSGSFYCAAERCGTYFWGAHNHDGLWHLEVVSASFLSYPFVAPTYAGAFLTGYNILLDLIIFLLSKIGIPPIFTYFKLLPIIWFFFTTAVAIWFSRKIKDSAIWVGSFLFFLFFGGSFAYFLTLYHEGILRGSANILALQAGQSLINLQFAFSLPVLFIVLGILKERKFTMGEAIILGICTFVNVGLKFYAGVITLFLVGLYLIEFLYTKKSFFAVLKAGLIIGLSAALSVIIFYNPFASLKSGSVFIFAPFAIVHSMIEERNLFYLPNLVNARYFLLTKGFGLKLLSIELFSTFLYVFFNFGTRFFGVCYFFIKVIQRKVNRFEVYIFLTIVFSTVVSILFIQKGVWWNTVQFFYYAIVLSNIFAAELLYQLLKKKKIFLSALATIIILLSLPTNIDLIQDFSAPDPAYISQEEMKALTFLQEKPSGVVFNSFEKDPSQHYGFFDYHDTGYISAFTGKQTYLGHLHPLSLMGIDYSKRLEKVQKFDCSVFNEADYIYYVEFHKKDYLKKCESEISRKFIRIFDNEEVQIYSRKK